MSPRSDSSAIHAATHPGGGSMWYFLRETFHSISDDDIFGRSAQLAYYFFFSIFPGFIFIVAVAAMVTGGGDGMRSTLMQHLASVVPPQSHGILEQTLSKAGNGAGRLTFGIVTALWSATVGMSAACDTLNAVHDIKEGRPYWKVQLTAIMLTLATAVLVLFAVGVLFVGDTMLRVASDGSLPGFVWVLIKIVQWVVAFALVALIFGIIYYWAPDMKDREWHWITPGAAVGIILWVLATVGLRLYLHYFNSYSVTLGSIGAVMILLLWFYIAGFALLTGAEINAVIEDIAAQRGDPQATAKGQKNPRAA